MVQHQLWAAVCRRSLPLLASVPYEAYHADSQLRRATPALDASVLFKHLWAALQASPRRRALFGAPLAVTSTDDPREHVGNVLDPVARSRSRMCYWSSAGSDVSPRAGYCCCQACRIEARLHLRQKKI